MTALIGRDHEIGTLRQALQSARQGNGCCYIVAGEAGIGKSRLLAELKREDSQKEFRLVQGYCFQQDAALPYAPWIDALRMFFSSLGAAEIRQSLGPFAPEVSKLLPELRLLLPDVVPNAALEPAAEKYRAFESLARFLLSTDTPRPCLIILEDLHWSDSLSVELFHFLSRRIAHLPVLLVGTYRTEESPPHLERLLSELNRERLMQEIPLKPLGRTEVEQLARMALVSERPLPASVIDSLVAVTDGNPFFVEEILQSVADEGRIREALWQGGLDQFPIPHSIQRTTQQRIEQLSEASRQILVHAAVIGERFELSVLQGITRRSEQELLGALKGLIDARLVVPESASQFAFRHALTRQAAYSLVSMPERRAMHQAIGETLERLTGTRADASVAQLAYHFYQGGVWHKALDYCQRVGQQALALYAPREALTQFTRALDAAQREVRGAAAVQARLYRGRARARELLDDFEGARADYEAALESARREADRAGEWQVLVDLGLLWQSRDLARAGEYYREALGLATELQNPSLLAQSLNRIGNWDLNRGRVDDALPAHQEALDLFRKSDDRRGMAQTLELLGMVSYQLGKVSQGTRYLEEAVPILRELDDRQALINTLTNLAFRARLETEVLGETDCREWVETSEEALGIARASNWRQGELRVLISLAGALVQAGHYSRALQSLGKAESLAEDSRGRESFVRLHLTYGSVFLDLLAWTRARPHFETALAGAQELGSGLLRLAATTWLVSALVAQKDLARAKGLLDPSLPAEYPEGQVLAPLRRLWSLRAELELEQGNSRRALQITERLLAGTADLKQYGRYAVPFLSRLRARALAASGRLTEAEAEFQGTLPIAVRQGQRPLVWRLHVDLGRLYRSMARREDAEREFGSARAGIDELAKNIPERPLRDGFLQQASTMLPPAHIPTPRQAAKLEFGGLTTREREIAGLIAEARSNREIADLLVISEKTTERHVANILRKLGFSSRTQIATWAVERGLRR